MISFFRVNVKASPATTTTAAAGNSRTEKRDQRENLKPGKLKSLNKRPFWGMEEQAKQKQATHKWNPVII